MNFEDEGISIVMIIFCVVIIIACGFWESAQKQNALKEARRSGGSLDCQITRYGTYYFARDKDGRRMDITQP